MPRRLPRAFFERPVLQVAPELLGARISLDGVTVRLTEVEAYGGGDDPGSHAFRGRTPRTEVMFGPPGGLYVYFTYGMHWCANLVCGPEGHASAVLLRAGEVVQGRELAASRRPGSAVRDLARGPARLTRALGLGRAHNGLVTTSRSCPVRMEAATPGLESAVRPGDSGGSRGARGSLDSLGSLGREDRVAAAGLVRSGPRVGVSGPGGDGTAYPWRFWIDGEPTVSVYRPNTRARRTTTRT
ncbi:MAG: 3-methyladenine DNA glycosylase [Actinomycetales bacterium]|nr:MAG: 3-methyladenine DNA glycosylase [Actinomycetales bacterium]